MHKFQAESNRIYGPVLLNSKFADQEPFNIQATERSVLKKAVVGYEAIHQFTNSLAGITCNCHTLLRSKYNVIISVSFTIASRGYHGS